MDKQREYKILFLVQKEKKLVHAEISFASNLAAVFRKHLRGEVPETKDVFAREHVEDQQNMLVWEIGCVTRSKAMAYLRAWKKKFGNSGYELMGEMYSEKGDGNEQELSECEKNRMKNQSVEKLLNGTIGQVIRSEHAGARKLSASQKFSSTTAEDLLRIRAKSDTINKFRELCKNMGITQNQGVELLMGEYTGNIDPLVCDLQERLEKANAELEIKANRIDDLRESLRRSEEAKEYPKKYRKTELQGELLKEFFARLPKPKHQQEQKLRVYSSFSGKMAFPEGVEYTFPEDEGIISLTLEHAQFSRTKPACVFIFGRDDKDNKVKIRWYPQKKDVFGESLFGSPYFFVHTPWLFAIQKEGYAKEMVGGLPNLGHIWKEAEEADLEYIKNYVETVVRESEELDRIQEDAVRKKKDDGVYNFEYDRGTPIDDIIKMIEKSKT